MAAPVLPAGIGEPVADVAVRLASSPAEVVAVLVDGRVAAVLARADVAPASSAP